MTDKFLTVEEALRGWLNGETLQCRPKIGSLHTNEQEFEGWKTFWSPSTVERVYICTATHDYRFKPKTHTVELTQQEIEMLWQLTRMVGGCEVKSPRAYTASASWKLADLIGSERQAKLDSWCTEFARGVIRFESRMPE